MTLYAKDIDLPPNGAPFTYKLVGGKQRDFVRIDRHSGVVTTTRSIDREVTPELNIIVEIEDSGSPKQKSQQQVKIIVMDQNDSPSSSRSVHVLVHTFNNAIPLGKIADVHPNDNDITGDYRCKIVQSSAHGLLSIPSACNLHTSRINPGNGYSLSITGNDGRHGDVTSTVTVEFMPFDNATVENSITIQVSNLTAQKFLANNYRSLLELLRGTLSSGETLFLYGLSNNKEALEITLAVKSTNSYRSKSYIGDKFLKKHDAMVNLFHSQVRINYSPCSDNTCENGGVCHEKIKVRDIFICISIDGTSITNHT